jgi:hypothetical protein
LLTNRERIPKTAEEKSIKAPGPRTDLQHPPGHGETERDRDERHQGGLCKRQEHEPFERDRDQDDDRCLDEVDGIGMPGRELEELSRVVEPVPEERAGSMCYFHLVRISSRRNVDSLT